jgi:pimeloyl-ACP methyl ester carboxylesterase
MRMHLNRLLAAIVIVGAAAICGNSSSSSEPAASDALSVDVASWGEALRQAGASAAEVARFQDKIRSLSPVERIKWEDYLRTAPPDFFDTYLLSTRREQSEPTPEDIFRDVTPVKSCEALHHVAIADTTIDAAAVSASDGSCRVTATVIHPPAHNPIKVFVALPTKSWNGRFRGTGGSGYAGGHIENLDIPVTKGYAVGATDTGNEQGTANFALDSHGKQAWSRLRDNAYLGIHDMTVVGKALTQAFYGHAPRYAYFVGGSTGGRQALTEAQRYPEDYDGILALYPAIARDRYVPAQLWPQILMREANDFLPKDKREAATAAAIKACDGADGVIDGVIDDPTRCEYDPVALVGTKIGDSVFSATDAEVVRGIWAGPKAHDGSSLWWGLTPGTDLSVLADTGGTALAGKPCEEGLDWFRYFLVLDPKWDWTTLSRAEFELLFEQSIEEHASVYGGDDPNLSGFRNRGGKLLIIHGLADQIVPPQESIAYFNNVLQRMGGPLRTAAFIRLFMVPGADHGFGSRVPVPSPAEMIGALLHWVERGQAPEQLIADLPDKKGNTMRTRPLFPYPRVAKYKGAGSTDEAANFVSNLPAPSKPTPSK